MALNLNALIAELDRNESVDNSAIVLINKLLADVEANKSDPVALQAAVDRFRAQTDKLAAAVANTTGAPPVPPPPA